MEGARTRHSIVWLPCSLHPWLMQILCRKLKTLLFLIRFTCLTKKHPQAAERQSGHTSECGVLFEQSRSQRRRATSVRCPTQASLAPRQRTFMVVKRCVRERGIHALHSFGSCCPRRRSRYAHGNAEPTKRLVRHPRAYSNALRVCRFAACGVGTGVEPVTARLRSGALPTELTGVVDSTSPSLESMFGSRSTNR
jgi:hypothetical protein